MEHSKEFGISLLYVEDESETRERIGRALQGEYPSFVIYTAVNGFEGLRIFTEHLPDIVITDIRMPIMNGVDMAREIRKVAPKTSIIVMSAYSDASYMLDAIKIGINRYILKPIDYDLLLETIEECLTLINLERQIREQNQFIRKLSRAVEQSQV